MEGVDRSRSTRRVAQRALARKGAIMRKLLWLAGLVFIILSPVATLRAEPSILTFTFDDNLIGQYNEAFRILDNADMQGTLFICTSDEDFVEKQGETGTFLICVSNEANEAGRMTWDQIREMHKAGWEIGAHSVSHPHLTQLSDIDLEYEVTAPIEKITEEVGEQPVSFATPYGEFNDQVLAVIQEHYQSHFMAWGGYGERDGENPLYGMNFYMIGRRGIENTTTSEEVCAQITENTQWSRWVVLAFHGVVEENPTQYDTTVETLTEIVACAAELVRAGKLRVLTAREALENMDFTTNLDPMFLKW